MRNVSKMFDENQKEVRKHLLELEAERMCMENGTPVTSFEVTKNAEETVRLADEIDCPWILKIVSSDFIRRPLNRSNPKPQELRGCTRASKKILAKVKKYNLNEKTVGVFILRASSIQQISK